MKIVIDANVYASSLMKPEGTIGKLFLTLFQDQDNYTIVTSPEIFLELERILKYPKVRNRIAFTSFEIDNWLSSIKLLTEIVEAQHFQTPTIVTEDPDDDKYILAALVSKATYLITGDQHLLKLNPYQNIRIITPREFLDLLSDLPK